MSETPEKIETKAFNIRAKVADHEFVTNFLKDYEPKHVGFSAFVKLAQQQQTPGENNEALIAEIADLKTQLENQPVKEVHQNLEQLFEFDEYSSFVQVSHTSILESIKKGLLIANEALKQNGSKHATTTVADFVPKELVDKVNLLHRHLLIEKKIPESTQSEYLEQLLTYSLKYFLLNEYPNIYNR